MQLEFKLRPYCCKVRVLTTNTMQPLIDLTWKYLLWSLFNNFVMAQKCVRNLFFFYCLGTRITQLLNWGCGSSGTMFDVWVVFAYLSTHIQPCKDEGKNNHLYSSQMMFFLSDSRWICSYKIQLLITIYFGVKKYSVLHRKCSKSCWAVVIGCWSFKDYARHHLITFFLENPK